MRSNFIGFVISFIFLFVTLIPTSYAGDRLPEGTVLTEESYVFSVEEAQELVSTIEVLEFEVEKQNTIIGIYQELDLIQEKKIGEYIASAQIKDDQLVLYREWVEEDAKRIKALNRQQKINKIERWGFFVIGIVVAGSAIIVADKVDDRVIENN